MEELKWEKPELIVLSSAENSEDLLRSSNNSYIDPQQDQRIVK